MAYNDGMDSLPGTMGDPRNEQGDTQTDLGMAGASGGNGYDPNTVYYPLQGDYSGYTTGQSADPNNTNFVPPPTGGSFFDQMWESMKRYGKSRAFGAVAQRAGGAAPLIGPVIAGMNAPEGKGVEAAGNSFGANTLNTLLYGINPILGAANSLYGMFTGKTLGGTAWNAMNTGGDTSGFNQNTAASGGRHNNMDNLATGLAGLYGANKANRGLNDQINSLTGMYGQNSPYAQMLRSNLERKDAKAGRRSQAGSREVQLQAELAKLASQNSGAVANLQGQKNNLNMQKLNTLLYFGRNSGLFGGMQNGISNWMAQNNNPNYGNEGLNYQQPVEQPFDYNQLLDQQG